MRVWTLVCRLGLALAGTSCAPTTVQERPVQVPPSASAVRSAPSGTRPFSEFRPSRDGFSFVNDFAGSSLPLDLGATTETSLGLPRRFGLCGGMSSAAADYFIAGASVPADRQPPEHGSALYNYLYKRQAASVGPAGIMGLTFLEWMRLPDDGPDGCRARTASQLPAIRDAISRGEPVLLGLVLTTIQKHREPWTNHQVLAYAMIPDAKGDGEGEICIYDPNFPGRDDAIIRITNDGGLPRCARIVPGRRDLVVRGLFRMAYTPGTPPTMTGQSPPAEPKGE